MRELLLERGNGKIILMGLLLGVVALLAACGAQSFANNVPPPATVATPPNAVPATVPATDTTTLTAAPTAAAKAATPAAQPTETSAASTTQPTQTAAVAAAPACTTPAALTPPVTEGPYFKAGSPERSSLITAGVTGTKLVLTGYVLTADCKPVANAMLDFWQANANGQYDNSGYNLRGHLYTDASGRYQLTTIVPGLYPGRTEHIHVKVQAPNGPVLTTQLFFPGVANNQTDGIFLPGLVMNIQKTADGLAGSFNFVISAS